MFTSSSNAERVNRAYSLGAQRFLEKSTDFGKLVTAARDVLGSGGERELDSSAGHADTEAFGASGPISAEGVRAHRRSNSSSFCMLEPRSVRQKHRHDAGGYAGAAPYRP